MSANKWEEIKKRGGQAIKDWIEDNMKNRSCVIVLVGEETANRKWVKHEIKKAWADGKGVLGIYIHNIKCPRNGKSKQGENPFSQFSIDNKPFDSIVKCYNPKSDGAYNDIADNIEDWIEEAIEIRQNQ